MTGAAGAGAQSDTVTHQEKSLPQTPHAAGKWGKGQSSVGVRAVSHLVHKNCLITGKILKLGDHSLEWLALKAGDGRAISEQAKLIRAQAAPAWPVLTDKAGLRTSRDMP